MRSLRTIYKQEDPKMKITKSHLKKLIKEELSSVLKESWAAMLGATKEIEADKARARKEETEDKLVKDMKDLMSPYSTDERSFIKWQERYHKSSNRKKFTEKIKQLLESDEGKKYAKEVERWVGNVIKFRRTGGKEGHQYTEEPWFARYMKTLQKWIDQRPVKGETILDDIRNHVAWITSEYVTDILFGDMDIGAQISSGYIDLDDAGIGAYGEEDD